MFPINFGNGKHLAVCMAAAFAITACSSNDNDKQMTMETPVETPAPEPLVIPSTMGVSSLDRQYADTVADALASMAGTTFAPLSAGYERNWDEDYVRLTEFTTNYVNSVTTDSQGGAVVEFVTEGRTRRIAFTADDIADWNTVSDDTNYYQLGAWRLGDGENPDLSTTYYDVGQWFVWRIDEERGEFDGFGVYGVATKTENLPAGTASYDGFMSGDFWNSDDNNPSYRSHRREIWGVLTLEANLGDSTISGGVDEIWVKTSRDDGDEWEEWSDTISMEFTNGRVVDGRFVAGWSGEDTSSTTADANSLRGFQGNLFGEFYGPGGEEVAGVFNGQRDASATTPTQIMSGIFGAEMNDMQ